MLSQVEGGDVAAFSCSDLKLSKEDVQFLHQQGVSISHSEVVGFVAGDVLLLLPHLPRVVAAEMPLYPPLVCCLGPMIPFLRLALAALYCAPSPD